MQEALIIKEIHSEPEPETKLKERKIGKTTFIVSTSFNNGKERDIVKTLTRLIENHADVANI